MTKRFIEFMTQNSDDGNLNCGFKDIRADEWYYTKDRVNAKKCVDILNQLNDENEQLKQELTIYRKLASCSNCKYHNYDWYDDGDEFEVCDKGNDVTEMICKDWKRR